MNSKRPSQPGDPSRIDPRPSVVSADPDILGGSLVFAGTRVPVQNLWEWLADGRSVAEFLENFPTVSRDQAVKVVQIAGTLFAQGVTTDEYAR